MPDLYFLHGEASRSANQVDAAFIFIAAICAFFFLVTQGLLIYFAVKYRRKKGEAETETPYITKNRTLEIIWVVVPSVLLLAIFAYGYVVFINLRTPIAGAEEVNVIARQWQWTFKYPDGQEAVNELRVPVGKPVKLVMTSKDVIHGFFVPAYRQKQDVLPGRYTYLWLLPERAGTFDIFCSQYCGTGHSLMRGKLIAMLPADYSAWEEAEEAKARAKAKMTLALPEKGEELVEKSGCLGCHSTDGTTKIGPTWKGLFGKRELLANGATVTVDDNFIKEKIYDPGAAPVKGFPPVMPTFKGQLSDDDVTAIIAYIKTLK